MRFQMESDFAKHVKGPELERVYLLHGTQPYLIANYEKLLVKKALGGEFNDFNLHRFEGDSLDLQAFYDAVESLPFFSEGRCVTLDIDPDKLDAGQLDELCGVLADPPRTTTVVITVKNPPAKREKLAKLVKACDGAGCVVELGSRRSSDTLRFLRDRAQKNGCELESAVASYMVERCTDDLQLLATELDKLCAYVGGGRIERADVDAVVTTVLQAKVFDLSKAILRGGSTRRWSWSTSSSTCGSPRVRCWRCCRGRSATSTAALRRGRRTSRRSARRRSSAMPKTAPSRSRTR